MIVAPLPDPRLLLTTQNDHAALAAEIAALWRADGLPDNPRRREILFAVREHDNGWREADSAPYVDPESGRPHSFITLPLARKEEIGHRAVERHRNEHPYAAALIAHHARHVYRHRVGEGYEELFAYLEQARAECLEASGHGDGEIEADYPFLELTDLASLVLANRWTEPQEVPGGEGRRTTFRLSGDGDTLHMDPFPLAGATSFTLACRAVPDRRYASDRDLSLTLAEARWERRRVRLAPPA